MDLRAPGVLAEALEVLDIEPVARGLDDGSLARALAMDQYERVVRVVKVQVRDIE